MVSFPGGWGVPGCGAAAGRAACNTNCPWRARAWRGHRGCRDLEGPPCCCAPMPTPRPRTWRPARWPARRAGPGGCGRGATAGSGWSGCGTARRRGCARGGAGAARAGATHVLLPSWCAPGGRTPSGSSARRPPHRRCTAPGRARIGAELGVPAATVRGWLRRLRARAGRCARTRWSAARASSTAGRDRAAARAGRARRSATRWPPSPPARTPRSAWLRPAGRGLRAAAGPVRPRRRPRARPPAADPAPARASPCPEPGRDAHHEHPASSAARAAVTVSIPAPP